MRLLSLSKGRAEKSHPPVQMLRTVVALSQISGTPQSMPQVWCNRCPCAAPERRSHRKAALRVLDTVFSPARGLVRAHHSNSGNASFVGNSLLWQILPHSCLLRSEIGLQIRLRKSALQPRSFRTNRSLPSVPLFW